jgi:ABC-type sugar transport system ATPase subunit
VLKIENLAVTAGDFRIANLNLEIPEGSYGVLLGPTGCGKTVLLETICGLRKSENGRILLGKDKSFIPRTISSTTNNEDVTNLPPALRQIGYVPQDYVLFPTMKVGDNIAIGLRARGVSRDQSRKLIAPTVEMLGIDNLLERWPATLSGGEQQRVALARALTIKPRLLLLDEPVSSLDEATRESVCTDLKRIQKQTGTTTLHICHNLEEARMVATHLSVMKSASIIQSGTPQEVFSQPKTSELARFLNVGTVLQATAEKTASGTHLTCDGMNLNSPASIAPGPVKIALRSDLLQLIPGTCSSMENSGLKIQSQSATIESVSNRGLFARIQVRTGPVTLLTVLQPTREGLPARGDSCQLMIPPEAIVILED